MQPNCVTIRLDLTAAVASMAIEELTAAVIKVRPLITIVKTRDQLHMYTYDRRPGGSAFQRIACNAIDFYPVTNTVAISDTDQNYFKWNPKCRK